MKLYELANPSDPYTFYAPSIEIAGVAAVLLSTAYGAVPADGEGERSPVMFGWDEWLKEKGIDSDWVETHRVKIADAYDSFLIGDASKRADIESMLEMLSDEKKQEWRDQRQSRNRSSMSKIGEMAYEHAEKFRAAATEESA